MSLKNEVKKVLEKIGMLDNLKKIKKHHIEKKRLTNKYVFENRMKNQKKVCLILAGYKPFLYDIVFKRIYTFIPEDIDVCILSSGIYSEELSNIAKENVWSYLSTKRNCVSLIQNVAINLFKDAEYIYKLDEDIFITENYFETLMNTMVDCKKNGEYQVGIVAPTIPINGLGNLNVLKRFNLVDTYKEKFEKPLYAAGRNRMIENDPNVAKFFWGEGEYLPNIDEMNHIVQNDKMDYVACPIRFSIGAILFTREFWNKMGMFEVLSGSCMGIDEEQICEYCISKSEAIIVSKNSIVGHLSFGKQNPTMKEYFENNKKIFDIHNVK